MREFFDINDYSNKSEFENELRRCWLELENEITKEEDFWLSEDGQPN